MNGRAVTANFHSLKGNTMKSIVIKASAVTAILLASAGAYASSMDCCNGLECCLKMLACCF